MVLPVDTVEFVFALSSSYDSIIRCLGLLGVLTRTVGCLTHDNFFYRLSLPYLVYDISVRGCRRFGAGIINGEAVQISNRCQQRSERVLKIHPVIMF